MNTEEQNQRRLSAARELMRLMSDGNDIDPLAIDWASRTLSRWMGIEWSDRTHSGRIVEILKQAGKAGCTTADISHQISVTENGAAKKMRMIANSGGCFGVKHQHRMRYFLSKKDADDWLRSAKEADANEARNEVRRARVDRQNKTAPAVSGITDREREITRHRSKTFGRPGSVKSQTKASKVAKIIGLEDAKKTVCPPCDLDRWGTKDFKGGEFVAEWRAKRKSR